MKHSVHPLQPSQLHRMVQGCVLLLQKGEQINECGGNGGKAGGVGAGRQSAQPAQPPQLHLAFQVGVLQRVSHGRQFKHPAQPPQPHFTFHV